VRQRLVRSGGYFEAEVPHHLIGDFVVLIGVGHDVSAGVGFSEGVEVEAGFEEGSLEFYLVGVGDSQGAGFVGDVADALKRTW